VLHPSTSRAQWLTLLVAFAVGATTLVSAIVGIDEAYQYQQRTREGLGYLRVGIRLLVANMLLVWSARSAMRIAVGLSNVVTRRTIRLIAVMSIAAVTATDLLVIWLTA
jgi:hypothetical protein